MENKDLWYYFRQNWSWTSYFNKDGSPRPAPVVIKLKDMETDHIIRCMLYPITYNHTPSANNMAILLTELLYRNGTE